MSTVTDTTTATQLLAYRKELIDGGISEDLAYELVRDAAREIVRVYGLDVRNV